jgi:4-hydroxy-tetrahydrodipicolinate synthase
VPIREQRLGGVCAATLTPLDNRREPDHAALVTHCRRLLRSGCDAINLLGSTGEATSLAVAARLGVMEAIAASGLPLDAFMVGTGAAAFADAVVLTRAAVGLGFAGALVVPPFYFKNLTADGVFRFYAELIAAVGDPRLRIYLYNFPQLSGFTFSVALVERLTAAFGEIIAGIKDSSGAVGYPEAVVAACPTLAVFPSTEAVLADGRAKGFAGCISATVNVNAPLAGHVWNGAHGAHDAHAALCATRDVIARHQLVPATRAVLAALLDDDAWLRVLPPLIELTPSDAAGLVAELDRIPAFATVRAAFACA